jgi:stage III sporulation protein AB
VLSRVFAKLSEEMVNQIAPNVSHCMSAALSSRTDIPPTTTEMLQVLGNSLGRFDMNGQLRGLDAVRSQCKEKLNDLIQNKDVRLRSYKTLGLCAGAAMVILFI